MSRTRQVLWASALSGASVFVSMAAWLAITKLAAKTLPPSEVAVFFLLQAWADALNILCNLGLAVSLPRLIAAAGAEDKHRTAGAALAGTALLAGAVAVLGMLGWVLAANGVAAWAGEETARFAHFAWLVPPLFLVGTVRDTAMAALAGFHRFSHRAASIVIASVLSLIVAGTCVALGSASVAAFSGAVAIGHGVNLVWLFAALPRGARWRLDGAAYVTAVRGSVALYQNNVLTFVYQRVDTLLAQRMLGLHEVALLGTAKYLPTILSRVMGALHVPLLPNLAGMVSAGNLPLAAQVMNRALVLTTALGYTAVLGTLALGGSLLTLIASEDYAAGAKVAGWLMAGMCLAIQAGIFGQGLIALGRPGAVTRANVLLAAVSLGMNLYCLPKFGLIGAGYSALGAILVSLWAQGAQVHRHGLPIGLRPWLTLHGLFLACAAPGLLGWGMVPGLLATGAYPLLAVLLGAVPPSELQVLLGAARPLPRR